MKTLARIAPELAAKLRRPGGGEPGLPHFPQVVANAALAAGRVVVAAARGQPILVPPEVAAARWAKCEPCPKRRKSDGRCSLCGCFTGALLVDKIKLATEACPKTPPEWGRWQS